MKNRDAENKMLTSGASKLKRTSFVDEICNYLRNAILSLAFKPGDQINESQLMKDFDVSRSPIREAFRILEGEGLIERISRRGVFVKKITLKEIAEKYSVRATLESLAAELSAPLMCDEKIEQLKSINHKMKESCQEQDFKKWSIQNNKFHKIFIKTANNRELEKVLKTIRVNARWLGLTDLGLFTDKYYQGFSDEHEIIIEAFTRKDPVLSSETVKKHILSAGEKVCLVYSKSDL